MNNSPATAPAPSTPPDASTVSVRIKNVPLSVTSRWPTGEVYASGMISLTQVEIEPLGDMTYTTSIQIGETPFDAYLRAMHEVGARLAELSFAINSAARRHLAKHTQTSEPPFEELPF